jgi:hypothetical protein
MNVDSICGHPSTGLFFRKKPRQISCCHWSFVALLSVCLMGYVNSSRGEAMLELFQMSWNQISKKMPEIAEAGYDSLWLPNPAKGNSGVYSIGYDQFDPFDLGSTNQQGTIPTYYGTQAELIQMVQVAHRFGIRVYFDNIMNHRSSTVPGYPGSSTPTNYYPGLIPQDFHLATVTVGANTYYTNWPTVGSLNNDQWCTNEVVENQPLLGLCDLAQEPGTVNWNFGSTIGDTTNKPVFIRFPGRTDLYMDTNGPLLGGGWYPFDGNGQPVPEDVTAYLCRAVAWTLYMTKCDGFRLDAVKHVPVDFFGNETGQSDDPSFAGYTGAIQAMYDYVHGYGSNVTDNGYIETDGNRNSLFNTEAARNDAMIFGEYEPSALAAGEDFYDYLNSGMRLLNFPLFTQLNSIFYGSSMSGMAGRDYIPPGGNCDANGNYSAAQAVNMSQTQDGGTCCPYNEGMDNAYDFMHEGLPMVYSDGFNHNLASITNGSTPIVSYANYLGEFGDNTMPDTMYLHNQLARGGTWSRWSDQNTVLFERYDYREGNASEPQTQDVALLGLNDDTGYPGDISFDDGISRTSDGYYLNPSNTTSTAVSNSRGVGIVVGFAPGSVLVQLASSSPTGGRAYQKLLVHGATQSYSAATNSANAADPTQRLIYVGGQTLATNGGAIELTLPSDSWVMYGYQWPQPSQANPSTNAIILQQGGVVVPAITIYRTDGTNGDPNYSPLFPFKMRGSVDPYTGLSIMAPGEGNVSNLTYAIDVPVVTNAPLDILVRSDASCSNTLVKLDGGIDLNSQMGLGPTNFQAGIAPTNFLDLRDNPPGYADDVFLGYEQTAFEFRNGPEKFAADNVLSNNIVSLGAETYYYTVGGTNLVIPGAGFGEDITNQTADWVYHDPDAPTTVLTNSVWTSAPATQMVPTNPAPGQSVDIWVKVGYQFQINTCYIYYTIDGSNPEGAFGMGEGTTQVIQANWVNHDSVQENIDWWMGTIPAQSAGTQVRYKVALFYGGSYGFSIGDTNDWPSIQPISDAEITGSKLFGLTQAAITNFNPATATVWLHNDLNPANTVSGLQSGFHILRARTFLPRPGQSSVYNTFLQTFYYAGPLPGGVMVYPAPNGTISNSTYTVVVRTDNSVSGVDFNIQDSNPGNDDIVTGQANGNGNDTNGNPIFVPATQVSPSPTLDLQYPNDLQEFRFNYVNVPSSGTAAIVVQLKDYANSLYTNRLTTLTSDVTTLAPQQTVQISSPAAGSTIPMGSATTYLIKACFTTTLDTNGITAPFTLTINGVLQPQASYIMRGYGAVSGCSGMSALLYNWTANSPGTTTGTNVIQVVYSNTNSGLTLSDTVTVFVPPAPVITGLGGNNQLVLWTSAPDLTYMVLATTNLAQPFQPISGDIASQGFTTSFLDTNTAPQKFYEIVELAQ